MARRAAATEDDLLRYLAVRGPSSALDARRQLGISQPTFSRLISTAKDAVLVIGRARATRYAARREIATIGDRVPIYEIDESGKSRRAGVLHAIAPEGFYVEAEASDVVAGTYADLPYFLDSMRPGGFLGRRIPARHPELALPSDVRLWSAEHCLPWASRYGWNLPGNTILGDEAFRLFLRHTLTPPDSVAGAARESIYVVLAEQEMAGVIGSSAGGEHPKFLASRTPGPVAVLVKFSPPARDATSRRIADLLVAEHEALETLSGHGRSAASSELVLADDRVFLEVERFDRLSGGGRRGLVSLLALDAQFLGRLRTWGESSAELARRGVIPHAAADEIRWLELFGGLIANTDMHFANLSLFSRGTTITGVAPAYDMTPMLYAPQHGHLAPRSFDPPLPTPEEAPIWVDAWRAARDFWRRVATHELISADFRAIAAENSHQLDELGGLVSRLS